MSLPLTLEKHNTVFGLLRALFWGRHRGCGTNDSPSFCFCSLALYLQTGLGSTFGPVVTHELKVGINHRAGEILGHEVSRIVGSEDLPHF